MRFLFLLPLRLYRLCISPLLGCHCRFIPSCSEYAEDALCHHGVVKGSWLAGKRLLRCGPWARGGYDPVMSPTPAPMKE